MGITLLCGHCGVLTGSQGSWVAETQCDSPRACAEAADTPHMCVFLPRGAPAPVPYQLFCRRIWAVLVGAWPWVPFLASPNMAG